MTKRTCPKCDRSIWVVRPFMPFGMHRPILLFDHKPTIQELDRVAWPVMSENMRSAFVKVGQRKARRRRIRPRRRPHRPDT